MTITGSNCGRFEPRAMRCGSAFARYIQGLDLQARRTRSLMRPTSPMADVKINQCSQGRGTRSHK